MDMLSQILYYKTKDVDKTSLLPHAFPNNHFVVHLFLTLRLFLLSWCINPTQKPLF